MLKKLKIKVYIKKLLLMLRDEICVILFSQVAQGKRREKKANWLKEKLVWPLLEQSPLRLLNQPKPFKLKEAKY